MADAIPNVVSMGKSEADVAAELKQRFMEVMKPALEVMNEAHKSGLAIAFDGIAPQPPTFKNGIVNLRVVKQY